MWLRACHVWSRPHQWAGHESTRKSVVFDRPIDFSANIRAKTYLQENVCHFLTTQSINTTLVPMERGTFRLPTIAIWSRPLEWVGHESTRKSGDTTSDGMVTFDLLFQIKRASTTLA